MTRFIGTIVLFLVVGTAAWADKFQIKEKKDGEIFVVPFATVKLPHGSSLGQTDMYGRITINDLENGDYQAEVIHGAQKKTATLTINGEQDLKVVYVD